MLVRTTVPFIIVRNLKVTSFLGVILVVREAVASSIIKMHRQELNLTLRRNGRYNRAAA